MQYVVDNKQMREADCYTITKLSVPSLELMERAGRALAREAERIAPQGKILCVCGGGNNGGDGFVCARVLLTSGREVDCLWVADRVSPDCETNKNRFTGQIYTEFPTGRYALIVDCLLGTGFHGALKEKYLNAVRKINESGAKVLSADIPSGLSEFGKGVEAVRADTTLCIGEMKLACFLREGIDFCGRVKRADIGIAFAQKPSVFLLDSAYIREKLPKRKRYSHKGSYGRAAIVAGSAAYTGAAYLSAAACLRSGAGYTALCVPKNLFSAFALKLPEVLLKTTDGQDRYAFNAQAAEELLAYDSLAVGMGMGVSEDVERLVEYLLANYEGRLVLDADALNSVAAFGGADIFANKKCDVILTPHVKEFARLTGESVDEILKNGVCSAENFAEKYAVTVLLKNAVSQISDGTVTLLCDKGNSGQAKGGSGDVLSGLIAGLCASGVSAFDGGALGAYIAGVAAEIAVEKTDERCLIASDVIGCIGKAFLRVAEDADYGGDDE